MALDLAALLDIRRYQAFDVDDQGRVLAGGDDSGSTQLIEIEPDGGQTPLTALPGPCSGRYLPRPPAVPGPCRGPFRPGRRAVLVCHDDGGNELHQISVLRLPVPGGKPASLADLEPLIRDPRFLHTLADVRP